jgi:hypothetical protein
MYRNATGLDSHSVFIDPKIKSISLPDLHLTAGSPAINSGINIPLMGEFDIDREIRANGIVDVGADEFYASTDGHECAAEQKDFHLYQNYPNPFNPSTEIRFTLPEQSNVTLEIYDVLGNKVRILLDGFRQPGYYTALWDGLSDDKHQVNAGMFIYRLSTERFSATRKMILIK